MDLLREAVSKYHSLKRDGLVVSDSPARTPATSTQLDATPCAPPTIDALTLLPPELLVSTLASCDNFDDVLSLVSTSKRLHQVYLENAAQVIWPVAVRSFLAFDHAVLAVRVTKKATDAYHAARLPERADLTIDKLSPFRRAPTVSELRDAFALDHFGQCFLDILKSNSAEQLMSESEEQDGITDKSIWHTVWSKTLRYSSERRGSDLLRRLAMERIIRALYRTVIWGAVMSRAYQEPLFDAAVNGLDNLAETWTYSVSGDGAQLQQNGSSKTGPQLSAQDIRHLSKYPAYRGFNLAHFSPYTKDETSEFSSVTDWLIRDMIQIEELETFMQRTDSRMMEKRTHALPVRDQVAQVAWVYQVLSNIIVDCKGRLRALRNPRLPFVASGNHGFSEAASTPVVRKLTLILPGMYQPEEITMPATVGDMIEIPSLDGAAARFSGVKKFTRLLFVAEPTIKNPCGIRMDGEGRYIAFPSLLSCASDSALTHKDIEIRPLASILYKHLQHRAPARFLTNIMFNNTSRGESWEYDALHAGVRWYNPPRKAKQVVEHSEEAEESEAMDVEEAEEVKEELEAMKEEESKGEGEMEEMDKMELDADCEEK